MDNLRSLPVKSKDEIPTIPVDECAAEVRAIKTGCQFWTHVENRGRIRAEREDASAELGYVISFGNPQPAKQPFAGQVGEVVIFRFKESAIYPSFPPHPKKRRYAFHILNRDARLLSVIFKG
jgi:hypothetical protein